MLVLSRRTNEEILFPNTGIRIRILGMQGKVARVGIEAPPDVPVLRAELAGENAGRPNAAPPGPTSHALRNRLHKVTLSLYRFQQLCQAGLEHEANKTFDQVLAALEALDQEWPQVAGQAAAKGPAGRRLRTLLVEDDANERELLAGILGMNGCDCDTAGDGQEALDYLACHERPDLVLLDMAMPKVSGPQMLSLLRHEPRYRGLKVFAISGSDPAEVGVSVGHGGVDAWFNKPLHPRRLCEAIRQ